MTLSILNPKLLERQLKLIEEKLGALQSEKEKLEKVRDACHFLLSGEAPPAPKRAEAKAARAESTAPPPRAPRRKKSAESEPASGPSTAEPARERSVAREALPGRIRALLTARPRGLSADEIYDELKRSGALSGRHPVAAVYATLEQHPEIFHQADDGSWGTQGGLPS
jgi:hypothetical protein